MRIRRNAKATTSFPQAYVCRLNQNPWDVIDFSPSSPSPPPPLPPPSQVKLRNDGSSLHSAASLLDSKEEEEEEESIKIVVCSKTDGKSWRCRREALSGNSLCEHHLSLMRSYSAGDHSKTADQRQPRMRPNYSRASNPYEFYYYSGFGPQWSKKRSGIDDELNPLLLSQMGEEDEEDEVDSDGSINRRKRARKPVKARSLKSLM